MSTIRQPRMQAGLIAARRVNQSLTAAMEKRALVWMAERAPGWVTSDGLTLLGLSAQMAAGFSTRFRASTAGRCCWRSCAWR